MKQKLKFLVATSLLATLSFGQGIHHKIDSILKTKQKEYPQVAISVGILIDGKEVYAAIGNTNRESDIPANEHSVFEIASITKALTGNLIANAANEGKIDLNGYIDDYLPEAIILNDTIKNRIKISDLASHQSGLPDIDFGKLIALNPQQPVKSVDKETINHLLSSCTELKDHGHYRYSTMGFILLGQILEESYGKTYDQIVKDKILDMLHMQHTYTKDFNVENLTTGYNPEGGTQEFFEWNIVAPAGLIKSNTHDMVSYLKAVLDEESRMGKASIMAERTLFKNTNIEIGLGINILRDGDTPIYAKTGDSMGQSSIMGYDREKQWGIIVLANERNSRLRSAVFNEIYESILK
ncbi:serine hydrolase domain-containing protein [Costertonia aggregata]|uniref:Beta-lactamase family protein n=1 Tax=Costertonia aggregata TaxID=343403 RepID=A0A7H9AS69_9FLAO|nr:serine hydrolase domain-containing protein [Costertonia aggregata]QLG46341.1 beta-lactamase family protein [Costertonia aggregata]